MGEDRLVSDGDEEHNAEWVVGETWMDDDEEEEEGTVTTDKESGSGLRARKDMHTRTPVHQSDPARLHVSAYPVIRSQRHVLFKCH
eukprot:2398423-Rhodomonas_salina.1